ncbi:hypothetical protein [Methanobacterium aggregans]|uniref:hypothetical protein n=1 Tax=Methanobacterium aggregans TaxID=1615586 RepID=UPI00321171D1|nr:hypothetical protein [Methanobacterium aggregans]
MVKNKPIILELESKGGVKESELFLTLQSDDEITDDDSKLALNTVKKIFNLDLDLQHFYH